jgi:putative restriction endonuclease
MSVKLVVAVTDYAWFDHLRQKPDLAEVNFWAPSAVPFKALVPGELFLFKLHSPRNFIVGGGTFTYANALPCSLAWEAFRDANGAATLQEMRTRIARYRDVDPASRDDFQIGCRILTQPFFRDEVEWLPVPTSFARNIVSFKTYSTEESDGLQLWKWVAEHAVSTAHSTGGLADRYGGPMLIRPRLGQGAFRVVVTDLYERRCAITRERTLPALEAAHIRPYSEGGKHEERNGLLLRRDLHSLFDAGYLTVTPELHCEVSRKIKEEFENGRDYYALHGQQVWAPANPQAQPDRSTLIWHNETRFLG